MIGYIKKYSPYVYLHQIDEDKYSIFVTIFHFPSQEIRVVGDTNVLHAHGRSMLSFDIVGEPEDCDATPTERYHRCEFIHPISLYGDKFDPKKFCVHVETSYYSNEENNKRGNPDEKYSIEILYEDADEGGVTIAEDIALDCPYLYLNNPFSEIASKNLYNPYCLVFTRKDFVLDAEAARLSKDDETGIFEQELQLIGEDKENLEIKMLEPKSIPANSTVYIDLEPVSGYFETIIYEKNSKKSKKKKRKGRLRNISADGNPTDFRSL